MREGSFEELRGKFSQMCKKLEARLSNLQVLERQKLLDSFEIESEERQQKGSLKFMSIWKNQSIEDEIWWSILYENQYQSLTLESQFVRNGTLPKVKPKYSRSFAVRILEKYNHFIEMYGYPYKLTIHPETGNTTLNLKTIHSLNAFEENISKHGFVKESITHINYMLQFTAHFHPILQYLEGYAMSFPFDNFFTKIDKTGRASTGPQPYIKIFKDLIKGFDKNCQQSLDIFTDLEAYSNFVLDNYQPFRQDVTKIIELVCGRSNNVEDARSQIDFQSQSEIIFGAYDTSFKGEGQAEDQFISRKITFLTPKDKINWKPIARGGYGLIEKALVKYELSDFSLFSKSKEVHDDYIIRKSDIKNCKKIPHEQKIFSLLKNEFHENIKAHYISSETNYIYSRYEQNLSMDKYLIANKKTITLPTILQFCEHISKGLLFLKEKDLVHLDIKPNNVLISKNLKAKISDFGQTYNRKDKSRNYAHAYTVPYAPAEVFQRDPKLLNQKVDVYAFGVTMYKCIFGNHIWGNIIDKERFVQSLEIGQELSQSVAPEYIAQFGPPELLWPLTNIALFCISRDQNKRPHFFFITVLLSLIRHYMHYMTVIDSPS